MDYTKIRYILADGIATIELTDPPANTYSYEMMREIDAAVLAARMDRAAHVIVLCGAGDKFFCAGANNGMLKDADPEFKYYVWDVPNFAEAIHEYAKQFTPPHKASKAVGRIKRAVQTGLEMSFGDGLALERELQQLLFESNDAQEGISVSVEKRKPVFKGS